MAPADGEGDAAKAGGAKEDAANAQIPDKVGCREKEPSPARTATAFPPVRTTAASETACAQLLERVGCSVATNGCGAARGWNRCCKACNT